MTDCRNCGEETDGRQSIPVNNSSDIVPINYKGPWGGVPCCKTCFDLHAAAGDNAPAVLDVYARAIEGRQDELARLRAAAKQITIILDGV